MLQLTDVQLFIRVAELGNISAAGRTLGLSAAAASAALKRLEQRVARNEARLAEAQSVAHVGSFEWDLDSNVVVFTDELHRIYGLEPGQFEGTFDAFLARVHTEDLALMKNAMFEACRQRKDFACDHRALRPDGSIRALHTRGDVVKDSHGNPIRMVGTSWDVTELTEATRQHERALSLLQTTLEATADGILVVDRTGKVLLVNERLRSLWKLSAVRGESMEEETVLEHMLAQVEDPDGFRAGTLELQARPESELVDVLRLKDGRVFERHSRPQRVGEAIVGRVWCYRDISEHDRLLRRALFLADATRLLASLDIERALAAVAHLIVPYAGDGCAMDLFGNGEPWRRVALRPSIKNPFAQDIHPLVRAGQALIYPVDSISYLGVPFMAKGTVLGAMTLAAPPRRTYTQADLEFAEQLGRRAALAIENARLYQSAQEALQARDEFLSIAAHEIRGPITSLHLSVQVLDSGKVPPEEQSKIFAIIEREDRRLLQFVNELLDVSRIRSGTLGFDFQEVDLGELVRSVTGRMSADVARAGSALTVNVEGQVRGEWDGFRLEQVVTNLLANAIKFGLGKPIFLGVSTRDGRAIIVVKDQGIGIMRERQGRIWRPFERGVPVRHYGGLGLGLYIVKTIVEALGGCVSVESAPGAGSTFTVALPPHPAQGDCGFARGPESEAS